ncbi:MAG: ABC transporter permease [Propionibacteriales bacterium]|nr:ABC transporter permease [Propionibacteriales bacterium]
MATIIRGQSVIVPILALIVAFAIGAILIAGQGVNPISAYASLFHYAWFSSDGLQVTLLRTAGLALTGLAVAIPLKIGMFNIGAQGQFLVGAITAAFVGYQFGNLPGIPLILVALVGGIIGGAVWGWISGILKAKRNVHEVISTIMLNYVAAQLIDWLLNSYLKAPGQAIPQTPKIVDQAQIGNLGPFPVGFLIAIVLAAFSWWLLRRTVLGFQFGTVGANPEAARYAGVKLPRMYAAGMTLAGGMAGLSGGVQTLGETHYFEQSFAGSLGFDGVTVALLARGNPIGVVPAAFLLASLRAGAPGLQFDLGVQPEIVDLVLAITLLLVSIPILAKLLVRKGATAAPTPAPIEEELR